LLTFSLGGIAARVTRRVPQISSGRVNPVSREGKHDARLPRCNREAKLPIRIKTLLDRNFPGWRLHEVTTEDCEWVKMSRGKFAYPQIVQGDFDGNGWLDYALLIDYYTATDDRTLELPPTVYMVAFLATSNLYGMQVVSHEGADYLTMMPKGSEDYDYQAQREFTYALDTILTAEGMGGRSFLFEHGKFRAIVTSD
jgi:hypothetical protein